MYVGISRYFFFFNISSWFEMIRLSFLESVVNNMNPTYAGRMWNGHMKKYQLVAERNFQVFRNRVFSMSFIVKFSLFLFLVGWSFFRWFLVLQLNVVCLAFVRVVRVSRLMFYWNIFSIPIQNLQRSVFLFFSGSTFNWIALGIASQNPILIALCVHDTFRTFVWHTEHCTRHTSDAECGVWKREVSVSLPPHTIFTCIIQKSTHTYRARMGWPNRKDHLFLLSLHFCC